jgi:hypothetical protein
VWRSLAVALASLFASLPAVADEWMPLRRLPPLSPAPVASFPQAPQAPRAESPTWFAREYVEQLGQAAPILRLPSISDAPGLPADSQIQLTSFESPVVLAAKQDAADGDSDGDKNDKPEEKKDGQTPPTFGRAPESNALQFLRAQDVLLSPGAWQFDTGAAYAHFSNDFPVPLFNNTGQVTDVVEGLLRRRLFYTPLAVRYGWSKNVQLFANMPFGFSNSQVSTFGTSDSTTVGGAGDLTAGASVHLLKAEEDLPDVIATMNFTAPTGAFSSPIFGLVPGSTLGQGFWAMSASLVCINRYDPIIVFYGGGYRHLFERPFDGLLFAPGEQIFYQFGVGFSVNDRVTLSTAFQGFYITDVRANNVTVPGSNLEPLTVRMAATIARRCKILEPFVQFGLTDSAPSANFGIIITYY